MTRTLRLVLMSSFVLVVALLATTVLAPQAPAATVASVDGLDGQDLVGTAHHCASGFHATPSTCPPGCRYVFASGCCYCP